MDFKAIIFDFMRKRHKHTPHYRSYDSAQHILILFESELHERNEQVKTLVKELQRDGKDVTAWGYANKPHTESAILRDYRVLSNQDFNFFGMPKDYVRTDIQQTHFDLLIDLNMNNLIPLRYLNIYADVDVRAGRQTDEPYLNEFMVDIKDATDPAYLFDQIIKFIKMIHAKN